MFKLLLLIIIQQVHNGHTIYKGYATPGQFPYVAAFFLENEFRCGATILSQYYVITAAHCFRGKSVSKMSVLPGVIDINLRNASRISVTQYFVHPQFNQTTMTYDVGILALRQPIKSVHPLPISVIHTDVNPLPYGVFLGYTLDIRGKYEYGKLKYSQIHLWGRQVCNCLLEPDMQHHMMCAGDYSGGTSFCVGDIGGPLVLGNALYGIATVGFGCGTRNPMLFTVAGYFSSWIKTATGLTRG